MKLIAPFGFYGAGNIGDESTLQGFARLLADADTPTSAWVGTRNVEQCRFAEPTLHYFRSDARRSVRRHWAWRTADAMVVPGGTPIMDVLGSWPLSELVPLLERATALGRPIAFIGAGTEELTRPESRRIFSDAVAPRVQFWTVRSERDRERLIADGVPERSIAVAADLAWGLEPVTSDYGRSHLSRLGLDPHAFTIGVNVNVETFVREQEPHLLGNLANSLDHMIDQHGARVLFLCNEVRAGATFDLEASREVISSMRNAANAHIVPNQYFSPQQMKSIVSCCRYTVSTRYHFCVFSALQGVPFVAIKRSGKVVDLCADLDWAHGVSLREARHPSITEMLVDMEVTRPSLVQHLDNRRRALKERAAANRTALESLGK